MNKERHVQVLCVLVYYYFICMESQPHVRVPNECFFDQPPRPGEPGFDSEFTPIELRRYIQQQRVLEKAVAANEKFNIEQQMKLCAIHAGSLWNAKKDCAELIQEYTRRLKVSPEYGVSKKQKSLVCC